MVITFFNDYSFFDCGVELFKPMPGLGIIVEIFSRISRGLAHSQSAVADYEWANIGFLNKLG